MMKKHFIFFALVWAILILFVPSASAFASPQHLPEDAVIFEPGVVLETDFGSFTALDAGFTKKAVESFLPPVETGQAHTIQPRTAQLFSLSWAF